MTRRWPPFAMIGAALLVQAAALWPGVMLPDAAAQYEQALSNRYDDWHPPIVAWIWHWLAKLASGPAPMLLLQLGLYWGGLALLAAAAQRRGRPLLAWAVAGCGLLPIAFGLMGAVLKDSLMAGACLAAAGLLGWSQASGLRRWRGPAAVLLLIASATRFNAFFAALPLAVALLPARWRRTTPRLAATTALAALVLAASGPVVARLLHAERSQVQQSMLLFDLGGITERGGVDVLPPMLPDQRAANHRCYSSLMWDSYSAPCPITFEAFLAATTEAGRDPYALWLRGVRSHPLAYAGHRLAHFNRNVRWLVPADGGGVTFIHSDVNRWGYATRSTPLSALIYDAALVTARTPLGWPAFWLAVAGAVLVLAPRLPSRRLIVPIAASALFYGLGYLVLSVASDLRYHLWTMIAGLLAAVLAGADLRRGASVGWRGAVAATIVAAVLVPAIVWRVAALPLPGGEQAATPPQKPPALLPLFRPTPHH